MTMNRTESVEHRAQLSAFEVRTSSDAGVGRLVGYAAVFDELSENLGGFREIIAPGAFDDVLTDDVRAFYNHDESQILGRTISNTLTLSVDSSGLKYDVDLPDTQVARDLMTSVKRGDVTQSSFGFMVARQGDAWDEDEESGVVIRTITKISRLFDVSPVAIPAYPQTDVAARSLANWQSKQKPTTMRHIWRARVRLASVE